MSQVNEQESGGQRVRASAAADVDSGGVVPHQPQLRHDRPRREADAGSDEPRGRVLAQDQAIKDMLGGARASRTKSGIRRSRW
jgi:hypothetical protein